MLLLFPGDLGRIKTSLAVASFKPPAWQDFKIRFEDRFPGLTVSAGTSGRQADATHPARVLMLARDEQPETGASFGDASGKHVANAYSVSRACVCGQVHSLHIHPPRETGGGYGRSIDALLHRLGGDALDALCAPCDFANLSPSSRERIETLWEVLPCAVALISDQMVALARNTAMEHIFAERRLFRPMARTGVLWPTDGEVRDALTDAAVNLCDFASSPFTISFDDADRSRIFALHRVPVSEYPDDQAMNQGRLFVLTVASNGAEFKGEGMLNGEDGSHHLGRSGWPAA